MTVAAGSKSAKSKVEAKDKKVKPPKKDGDLVSITFKADPETMAAIAVLTKGAGSGVVKKKSVAIRRALIEAADLVTVAAKTSG